MRLRRKGTRPQVSGQLTQALGATALRSDERLALWHESASYHRDMADRPELSLRKTSVLHAVVEAYVATGEPVGSETIAERAESRRLERHDP